ncbi:MAG: M20 family metallopeptidase [Gammaproteobacteria bacterium]|nr:M20 family metallopeptidase [Gammaproteobacteria bacterium]
MTLLASILAETETFKSIRRDLHAHPELGYTEYRTAKLVVDQLTGMGIDVHHGIGITGVVGVIKGLKEGASIALRADMDALPLQEHNAFDHVSQYAGKMHACGHDGHTATLLAAASHLAKNRHFAGTVYLIFQPAEEGGAGAKAMIEDGLFERFHIDEIYGYHNWPGYEEGTVGIVAGAMMASASEFEIKVIGKGAHAAMPHLGADPLLVSCQLVQALQSIVTRNVNPLESVVLSVTKIHCGDATNIIADDCTIEGTVRCFSEETLQVVEQRMAKLSQDLCAAFECDLDFAFERAYPATINHAPQAEYMRQVAEGLLGADRVTEFTPTMGSEDFSFFLQQKPGCYFALGNGDGDHRDRGHGIGPCTLHNPSYDFNDALIPIGANLWVDLVMARLGPEGIGHK